MFSLGMCHKHILQQEKKLYKIFKDPYIILMFIPKNLLYSWNFWYGKCFKTRKYVQILI
jgi:hypothetical protein